MSDATPPAETEEALENVPLIDADMLEQRVDFERHMSAFPLASTLLMLALAIVFVAEVRKGAPANLPGLVEVGALARGPVFRGEVWRLVSAVFLHADFGHLTSNALMLYVLGIGCEHGYGRSQFLVLFLGCGVAGSLLSLQAGHVSVGASGAVFGIAGAMAVLFWRHRRRMHLRDKRIGFVIAVWAGYSLLLGFTTPGIDNLAHLGGLGAGVLFGLILRAAVLEGRDQVARIPLVRAGLATACLVLVVVAWYFLPGLA